MTIARTTFVWLFLLSFAISPIQAQVGSTAGAVNVAGKIVSVKDNDLLIASRTGQMRVRVAEMTVIRADAPIKFSDIAPGMYLGTTAAKQADGTFRASEVHVFGEDQRGTGEGHRPSSSVPGSTMTNANVEKVEDVAVENIKGRIMTLKYKGGEVRVFVAPDIPIVKRVPGNREMLKPGAEVSIQTTAGADGSFIAKQITVRASRS